MRKHKIDLEIGKRAKQSIAHGALTNSKRPESMVKGVYPTHLKMARGALTWDTAGNRYIDFICGLGTTVLGANSEHIAAQIQAQLRYGITYSLGSDLEVLAAEKIKQICPFVDKVRFLKTGTEATSAAIRISRSFTQKANILSGGYHGWSDEFVSLTTPASGVVRHVYPQIRKLGSIEDIDEHTGAVIIEPIITDFSPERVQWLRELRDKCTQTGALLIFDEIITGFRFPGLTLSKYIGVYPDIICLGKSIANGMPLAVVAGKDEIMESDYFVSSTYAGECLSLKAMLATISEIQELKFDDLWLQSNSFQTEFNKIHPDVVKLEGYGTRGVFVGSDLNVSLFMQECCKSGILIGPSFFFGFQHIEYKDMVLNTMKDILTRIKLGNIKLEGEMRQTPFAQKVRENAATN